MKRFLIAVTTVGLTGFLILSATQLFSHYLGPLRYVAPPLEGTPAVLAANTTSKEFVDTSDPNELLPDLLPLPARDFHIQKTTDGRTLLLFSATYYNQGRGPVELRVDDEATNVKKDINRDVQQRIYFADGTFKEKIVGTFMWHQEHLHYHFSNFIDYDLEAVDAPSSPDLSGSRIKATFCLRDTSKVEIALPHYAKDAGYTICGKKLQGVSVGWGDTYYYNYPAQNLDITSLASGTYRLKLTVNPGSEIEEITETNNVSTVVFRYDKEKGTVKILEEMPENSPKVDHVRLDDPFGM